MPDAGMLFQPDAGNRFEASAKMHQVLWQNDGNRCPRCAITFMVSVDAFPAAALKNVVYLVDDSSLLASDVPMVYTRSSLESNAFVSL